jgi:LysR family transcriptional regulator, glycine cleavage system transcriptional activator
MTKRSLPPLKSLVALEAVVRHGSVTTAAAELCVTHGAISKHLASLEEWLGLQLFLDNRRRMVPTDAALTLAEGVGAGLAAIESSLDAIRPAGRGAQESADTVFQIIAPATFAMHWLMPRLPDLKRSGTTLKTRVRPTHTPENWRELTWDLAIRSGDRAFPTDLTAIPLFRDTLGLLAAPGLHASDCDLRKVKFLESETRPGELDDWLAVAGLARSDTSAIETFEHNYIALEAALSGQGAVVAPLGVVAGQIERGTLIRLAPELVAPGPLFTALLDPRNPSERHARALVAWLKKQIGTRLALVA